MDDIFEHKKQFDEVIKKYSLSEGEKAQEIAQFLTNPSKVKSITSDEFAKLFAMEISDAKIFLSFIEKGLNFKKDMDKNKE